ncbi:MAG: hypothetical protein OEY64_05045 [Nitrospinota bacterium]|nr:hypothetical protein [Nitrospinota bacterium]
MVIKRFFLIILLVKASLVLFLLFGGEDLLPEASAQNEGASAQTPQEKLKLELFEEMKKKQEELDKREEMLNRREDRTRALELDMSKKIDELKRLQVRIDDLIRMRDDLEKTNVANLSKTYSMMAPDEAAARLKTMDRAIALQIVGQMKSKNSARILSSLDQATATEFSEQLAKRRFE